MLVVPIVDQPRTENEIVNKIAVLAGGTAGLIVNPGGVSTSTQNLFATTNKMASFFAATKGVTNCTKYDVQDVGKGPESQYCSANHTIHSSEPIGQKYTVHRV